MMNAIWAALVIASVVTAGFNGKMASVSQASLDSARSAVELAIGLVGVMAFWLGMMRVVRDAGFLSRIERLVRPVMRALFPDVPAEHPAMQAMIMNIATNMLGLGNAATPFGLKAMNELNRLNPVPGVATNAMVLFLAINTSNVAVAPLGVIALRAAAGSDNAAGIWLPTLLATSFSTLMAIAGAKLLQRLYPPVESYRATVPAAAVASTIDVPEEATTPSPAVSRGGCLTALGAGALLVVGLAISLWRAAEEMGGLGPAMRDVASTWTLPGLIVVILLYGIAKRVDLYDSMIQGAKEGFEVAVRIIPFLVTIMVAVGMFRASGLLDLIIAGLDPVLTALGFPAAALPMAILRPLSGSGAFAVLAETIQAHGPDSLVGYLVSTLQGSSETTFYVLAVYFGSVGVTRFRHAIAAGLIADLAGVIGATVAVRLLLAS